MFEIQGVMSVDRFHSHEYWFLIYFSQMAYELMIEIL